MSTLKINWLLGYKHGSHDKIYGCCEGSGESFLFYGRRMGAGRFRVIAASRSEASDRWSQKRGKGYEQINASIVPDLTSRLELGLFHDVFLNEEMR